jgi:hypothetical protein
MFELKDAEMSQVCGGMPDAWQLGYDVGRWIASFFGCG